VAAGLSKHEAPGSEPGDRSVARWNTHLRFALILGFASTKLRALFKRKKNLDGRAIAGILKEHGILAATRKRLSSFPHQAIFSGRFFSLYIVRTLCS
jgi:hypothetical protein